MEEQKPYFVMQITRIVVLLGGGKTMQKVLFGGNAPRAPCRYVLGERYEGYAKQDALAVIFKLTHP